MIDRKDKANMQKIISIYKNGMDNRNTKMDSKNLLRECKLVIYYIVLSLVTCRRKSESKKIFFINGKAQRKKDICLKSEKVYRGDFWFYWKEVFYLPTVISEFHIYDRVLVFLVTFILYIKNRKNIYGFGSFLDYMWIYCYIKKKQPVEVDSRGHYDEVVTWLGGLSEMYGYRFSIYQHGVVSEEVQIPHKIPCNRLYAFNNYSIYVFKNYYISTEDCIYSVYPFKSSVNFLELERKKGFKYIGIIEQANKEWVRKIIDILRCINLKIIIVIMLHPVSQQNYDVLNGKIMVTRKKYKNFDLIISEDSTLILDYYREGIIIDTICTKGTKKNMFEECPFIIWAETQTEIREKINECLKGE